MSFDYASIIHKKIKNDEIGHFYLLSASNVLESPTPLSDWVFSLLADVLSDSKKTFTKENVLNHEDLLVIDKETDDNSLYKINDFNEMFSFLNYNATRFNRKFIVINHADKFSISVANKLLKTLEEPPIKATIFLLNPLKTSLLDTIKSRSISLSIPLQISKEQENFVQDIIEKMKQGQTLDEFISDFKSAKHKEITLYKSLNNWAAQQEVPASLIWKLEQINLQTIEDHSFNASPLNRLHKIYSLLKEYIDG